MTASLQRGDAILSDGPTPEDLRAKVFRDRKHTGDWRVEKLLDDGESSEVAIFSGGDARQRAIQYADREYGAFDEIELEPYNYLSEHQIAAEREGNARVAKPRPTG
jgi:hypothetical protein